jgi:hypothetical protein
MAAPVARKLLVYDAWKACDLPRECPTIVTLVAEYLDMVCCTAARICVAVLVQSQQNPSFWKKERPYFACSLANPL